MKKIFKKKVLFDEEGKPSMVILDYETYQEICELIEDIIDIKAVKNLEPDELIDWEEAKKTI
jgi:hypothetical protein